MRRTRRRVCSALVAAVAIAAPLALAGPAEAGRQPKPPPPKELTVMSYNLYLGSSLTPALNATNAQDFLAAVATIFANAQASDFPTRAQAVAGVIAEEEPDLIGLQEVTHWVATKDGAPLVDQDFLEILLAALEAEGMDYEVASTSHNADIAAPLVVPQLGCNLAPAPNCTAALHDRDVILVNEDTKGLKWWGADSGTYSEQMELAPPPSPLDPDPEPISFSRGWASIEGLYRGERFRFVDTHLEVDGFADVQEAQAREFLAGPARSRHAVIAVGDFNSAADGSTTDSYRLLVRKLRDAWWVNRNDPGYTSGQAGDLSNEVSQLDQRIDLVLFRSAKGTVIRSKDAEVVGDEKFRDAPPPLWPSDHASVVADLLLR